MAIGTSTRALEMAADADLTVTGALLDELAGGFRHRDQTLHQDLHHARQQQHDGGEAHAGLQHLDHHRRRRQHRPVADQAEDQADHQAEHHRLAEDAEPALDGVGVEIDVTQTGGAFDQPVDGDGDRQDRPRGEGGDRHAGDAVEALHAAGRPVGEEQAHRGHQGGGGDAHRQRAGGGDDQRADEGEVPEVPDVDVERPGQAAEQHQDVDGDADRDDPQPDRRAEGDRRGRWPTDVDDVALHSGALDDRLGDVGEAGEHQADHQIDTDEGDTDGHGSAEGPSGLRSQDHCDDEDDDGQEHSGPQTVDDGLEFDQYTVHDVLPPLIERFPCVSFSEIVIGRPHSVPHPWLRKRTNSLGSGPSVTRFTELNICSPSDQIVIRPPSKPVKCALGGHLTNMDD
jgi:hypothetical protein